MIRINGIDYYDKHEASSILHKSKSSEYMRNLRRSNKIDFIKNGQAYFYPVKSVDQFVFPKMGKRSFNADEINEKIKYKFLKIITQEKRIVCKGRYNFKCLKCNTQKTLSLQHVLQEDKIICRFCISEYSEEDIKINVEKRNISLISGFHGIKSEKLKWLCKKCNTTWKSPTKSVIDNNTGCPNCNIRKKLSKSEINNRIKDKHVIIIGEYKNIRTKTNFICHKCNRVWESLPQNVMMRDDSCPKCSKNKNEKLTGEFLKMILPESALIESSQMVCINGTNKQKGNLIVDYQVTHNNKIIYVEYNGAQHYQPIKMLSKMTDEDVLLNFDRQKKRDQRLREYCYKNNIKLIEIDGRKYKGEKIKDFLKTVFSEL